MSVEQPSTKRSKKADAKANASGSTVSAAGDVNDHKHLNASLTLLRTQDDLIALAGLTLDHDLVIKSWSSLTHVQPKEGRKEVAPREIKFRFRRHDTPQSEREPAVPKRGARERKIPRAIFLCFFFLFIIIPEKI